MIKRRKKSELIKVSSDHELMTLLDGDFYGAQMVKLKTPYAQQECIGCFKKLIYTVIAPQYCIFEIIALVCNIYS